MHCQMCGIYFKKKTISNMHSCIDPVGSVMFVERSSRHQETHGKNRKLVSPLFITFKGILSHPKGDWPCQDFAQGSTREQPSSPSLPLSFLNYLVNYYKLLCYNLIYLKYYHSYKRVKTANYMVFTILINIKLFQLTLV